MIKTIFNIKFVSVLFVFGMVFSGCNKLAVNTAQSSNVRQNITDTSASAGSSTEKNANSVINPETENAQTAATPDKEQKQKAIDQYIAGVAKDSDAEEFKEARKAFDGDLDDDGDEDAAAQFTVESMGGSNNYAFYLAVFRNENGKFTAVTDEVIGGKNNRDMEFKKIENGTMYFDTKDYGKDDGACCPSIAGKTTYILEGNKLIEKKIK